MTDPILLFLAMDVAALLLLGCLGRLVPRSVAGLATTSLCGLGVLLCLPALLAATPTALSLPIGPPGLSQHLALDGTTTVFLLIIFICGTAVTGQSAVAAWHSAESWSIPLGLAGVLMIVLAADGTTLAAGIAITGTALTARPVLAVAAASLVVLALSLVMPPGSGSGFDLIRTATSGAGRLAAAVILIGAAVLAMLIGERRPTDAGQISTGDMLAAGGVIPAMIYFLLRLLLDLPGPAIQAWWGYGLLMAGAAIASVCGWRAVKDPDIGGSVVNLVRQQSGLAIVGLGLTLIAKSADLPAAAASSLAATLLLALTAGVGGTLACLAGQALAEGAGTSRLARLGGLIHTMPVASAGFAAALFALSALPPAAGFAGFWLLFQSLLSAPRTGGLISQVPMALIAATIATCAALSTATFIRLTGVVVLSRPRSVRGSAARDVPRGERPALLVLACMSLLLGFLPGAVLKASASVAIRNLTGGDFGAKGGWMTLSAGASGYAPLPMLAMMSVVTAAVVVLTRRKRSGYRIAGIWTDGQAASPTMPFGDPMTQSAGAGFLPALPDLPVRRPLIRRPLFSSVSLRLLPLLNRPAIGLWAILLCLGALLLVLSLSDTAIPA